MSTPATIKYPKILAFSGKIGSGKNYLSENQTFNYFRSRNKNVLIIAFADYLKTMCVVKERILYERLFHNKDEESRRTLQTRGMIERKEYDNIFIEVVECNLRLAAERGVDIVIISDLRFKNEFEFLKNIGATLIRIDAPNRSIDKVLKECNGDDKKASILFSHISEIDLDSCNEFDYYLANDYENENDISRELYNILEYLLVSD